MMMKMKISKFIPMYLLFMSLLMFSGFVLVLYLDKIILFEVNFFYVGKIDISFPVLLDSKGLLFSSIVYFISYNVMKFSTKYMESDKFIDRFTYLVILFIVSMSLMIFIPHLGFILLGWDGLGIISFVLVIYYFNNKSLSAGLITAITNRIGDVFILMSIGLMLNLGHLNMLNFYKENSFNSITLLGVIFIMIASMTKSAQIPFSSWLPAAMAAPTPVSALVHSSTLVTAGVFLLIRMYPFLYSLSLFNLILLNLSMATMLMSGLCACLEWDMKKIIALSTLSQLGLMMATISINLPNLAFIHMAIHALFKALLFICAGNMIMNFFHSQDLRWMGNLSKEMYFSSNCVLLSSMAMAGFPFLASFYSKDQIMEFCMFNSMNMLMLLLFYISIGITTFYSFRFCYNLLFMPFMSISLFSIEEDKCVMSSMFNMSVMCIISGVLLLWLFPWDEKLVVINKFCMMMPCFFILVGTMMSVVWSYLSFELEYDSEVMYNNMWFMSILSGQFMMFATEKFPKLYLELIDQSWIEILGGYGMFNGMNKLKSIFYNNMIWNLIYMLSLTMMLILMLVMM
uniref:NADH dehydrogenase subunit 5 n=1 Tax=Dinobdella ferox TaxID=755736 RepID=UPI0023D80916|nr:NADH dehydrogenase subunit 5 [Dinobdella ferox]WDA96079.1 NADH dehydrogenase subunit 5 [Dinobdella ferox]